VAGVARVIRRSAWRPMPWKNGLGVTHELLREGDGAPGFALRLSVAEVSADAPFSRFDGVDRVLTLLEGAGLRLRRDDGRVITLDRVGEPFAFAGEDVWDCALLGGATLDFNVMTDRAQWIATARRCEAGVVEATYALALAAGRIGEEVVGAFDLAALSGPVEATVATVAVTLWPRDPSRR
jgi:environmental stress-induced protein Ves